MLAVSLLAGAAVVGGVMPWRRRLVRMLAGLIEWEGDRGRLVVGGTGSLAILTIGALSLAFWSGATTAVVGGLGKVGGTGSATPGAPVVSDLSTTVLAVDTMRVMFVVTPQSGSTHDSSRIVIRRPRNIAGDTLIDSIFGAAVNDTVLAQATLVNDTTLVTAVRAHATNGAGWSAEAVDTFANTASIWPDNEPAGMTLIASTNGSDKYFGTGGSGTGWFFGGRWTDATPHVGENVTCSGSRYGTCVTKRLDVGDGADWNGLAQYDWRSTAGAKRHVYLRTITKYSSNYQVCSNNEKPYGYLAYNTGGAVNDLFMSHNGGTNAWHIANQGGGWSDHFFAPGFTWSANEWITTEVYAVGESTTSASDGELYVWINGTQQESQTGVDWGTATSNWYGMSLFNYWGGATCTKTVQDTIFISEVYVSGKN